VGEAVIGQIYALYKRELLRLVRSRYMWLMIVAQPLMWVAFFGSSLAGLPRAFLLQYFGVGSYLAYMLPGMASVVMMSVGIFSSMSLIYDKRIGYMKRLLVAPVPKSAIFAAKALGAATRGLLAVAAIIAAGAALGASYSVNPAGLALWVVALAAAGAGFSALFIALTVKTADLHAPSVVANFITMPVMFASTALFPRQFFPEWLRAVSDANPLTHLVELGRSALIYGSPPDLASFMYVVAFSAASAALAAALTERLLTAD
jgi:ABC-2 type transport system permease protein